MKQTLPATSPEHAARLAELDTDEREARTNLTAAFTTYLDQQATAENAHADYLAARIHKDAGRLSESIVHGFSEIWLAKRQLSAAAFGAYKDALTAHNEAAAKRFLHAEEPVV